MWIDTKLSTDSNAYNIHVKIILSCAWCIVYKVILNVIFCINNEDDCFMIYFGAIMYKIQMFSFDITMMVSFFIFYSLHLRIKTLTKLFRNNKINVAKCLDIYRNIVKSIYAAKKCFDYLYVLALMIFVPDLIVQFYVNLTKLKTRSSDYLHSLVVRNLHAIQNFMLLCSPAVGADLVTSSAQELKLLFHDKLLQAKEEEQAMSLERFLNYIDGHPLRFTVFKIIPLDWTLPVMLVNLVLTYQIIIVQLTKLY
ncbi:hypothetical protein ABMA28_008507 [Loxostege sticticalis]|uniref:Gustatory receptor n=1 Tax=Loxostege sticticalis TaxID=481309 RepID=A0ABD0SHR3_LOXSC